MTYNHDTREDWETGPEAEDKFNSMERWIAIDKQELEDFLRKAAGADISVCVSEIKNGRVQLWCPRGQDMSEIRF